jgi:hypothetical protein
MEAKIFVIAFPTMETVAEKISSLLDEAFCSKPKAKKCEPKKEACKPKCCERDFTPPRFKNHSFMPPAPIPQWGVCGEPANDNLRFGAAFEIDEPRCEDYDKRWQFESDHAAFDRFVEAGEDCVARGLDKKSNAPITKCQAVRKRLGEAPPMNKELIGETHWWETFEDFDF